ncbi:MAG: GntR family transcriptional regulator [Verrucomicrobiae bacterium]|nr:GntR family transcriptional regulator [Verrucomicrobiae bacterium]
MPLYRQILHQLRQCIASGQLSSGTQLPSVRDFSQQLHVKPLTILIFSEVFQLLEREELVESRPRLGIFVKPDLPKISENEKRQSLMPAVKQLVTEARHLCIEQTEVEKMVRDQFKKIHAKTENTPCMSYP